MDERTFVAGADRSSAVFWLVLDRFRAEFAFGFGWFQAVFPAERGPETRFDGSGSKNGSEGTHK